MLESRRADQLGLPTNAIEYCNVLEALINEGIQPMMDITLQYFRDPCMGAGLSVLHLSHILL